MPSYSPPQNPPEGGTGGTGAITVSSTAAIAVAASGKRQTLTIKNYDAVDIFFGYANTITADSVDATAGMPLAPGEPFTFDNYKGAVWAIVAAGTAELHFIEEDTV